MKTATLKKATLILPLALLAACANEPANPATGDATPVAAAEPATSAPAGIATATGTVESIDAEGGRIVIDHGPVASLQWPAMTMGFEATPEQIASVQPGQAVEFRFSQRGSEYAIVDIAPER